MQVEGKKHIHRRRGGVADQTGMNPLASRVLSGPRMCVLRYCRTVELCTSICGIQVRSQKYKYMSEAARYPGTA